MKVSAEHVISESCSRHTNKPSREQTYDRSSFFNTRTKVSGRRLRISPTAILESLLLVFLVIGCKEEKTQEPIITEKKEESPVLRVDQMTKWVLDSHDSIQDGFAKAESELTKENSDIDQILDGLESLIVGKGTEAAEREEQLEAIKKELIVLCEDMGQMSSTNLSDRKLFKQKIFDVEEIIDGRLKDIEEYDLPFFIKLSEEFQDRLNSWKIALVSFRNASSENAGKKMAKLTSEYFHNELGLVITMRKAAWGDTDSQFNLGLMYEKGLRFQKDHQSAIKWYLQSEKDWYFETRAHLWKMYKEKGEYELAKKMQRLDGKFPEVILKLSKDAERIVLLADYLNYGSLHLSLLREKNKIEEALSNVQESNLERSSLERKSRETKAKISRNLNILEKLPQESADGSPFPWKIVNSSSAARIQAGNIPMDERACYQVLSESMYDLITLYKRLNSPVIEMRIKQLGYLAPAERWEVESALFLSGIPSAKEAPKQKASLISKHVQSAESIDESLAKFLIGVRHTIESVKLLIRKAGFPDLSFGTNLNWFPENHQIYEIIENETTESLRISMEKVSKEFTSRELLTLKKLISEYVALTDLKEGMSPHTFSLCIPSRFDADLSANNFSDLEMNNLFNLSALLEQCSIELTTSILYCLLSEDLHGALLKMGQMSSDAKVFLEGTGEEIINRAQLVMIEKTRASWVKDHGLISPLISETENLRVSLVNVLREISLIAEKDENKDPMETIWKLNQVFEDFLQNWKQFGCPPKKYEKAKFPSGNQLNSIDKNRIASAQKGKAHSSAELSAKRNRRITCMHRRAVLLSRVNPKQFLRFMEFASYHYLSEWSMAAKMDNPNAIHLLSACYRNGLERPKNIALSNQLAKVASELKYKH